MQFYKVVCLYLLLFSLAPLTIDSHYIYSWQVVALTALWEVSHLQLWAGAQRVSPRTSITGCPIPAHSIK